MLTPSQDDVILGHMEASDMDINHPLRRAYIEYVRECRTYGDSPLTFSDWVETTESFERFLDRKVTTDDQGRLSLVPLDAK